MANPGAHAELVEAPGEIDAFGARVIVFLGVELFCSVGCRNEMHNVIVTLIAQLDFGKVQFRQNAQPSFAIDVCDHHQSINHGHTGAGIHGAAITQDDRLAALFGLACRQIKVGLLHVKHDGKQVLLKLIGLLLRKLREIDAATTT